MTVLTFHTHPTILHAACVYGMIELDGLLVFFGLDYTSGESLSISRR